MNQTRRSILSTLGVAVPFGIGHRAGAAPTPAEAAPVLRLRSFEEAVRTAFSVAGPSSTCHRIEIGHSEEVRAGVQCCHNDRPFAGFPAGHLRIVRTGSEPGPMYRGVRLYVATVDVALTDGLVPGVVSRPLDFASLPPAAILS
ncbi:hypothetical protein [Aquisphaera insulae]|uniref:hypothetical protein n=1 Tax=Aquisphaera insulae TaxID=2712864 RepID=UPI0013ECDF51|nr:hypothetical protein [Aquisphaera insulae]